MSNQSEYLQSLNNFINEENTFDEQELIDRAKVSAEKAEGAELLGIGAPGFANLSRTAFNSLSDTAKRAITNSLDDFESNISSDTGRGLFRFARNFAGRILSDDFKPGEVMPNLRARAGGQVRTLADDIADRVRPSISREPPLDEGTELQNMADIAPRVEPQGALPLAEQAESEALRPLATDAARITNDMLPEGAGFRVDPALGVDKPLEESVDSALNTGLRVTDKIPELPGVSDAVTDVADAAGSALAGAGEAAAGEVAGTIAEAAGSLAGEAGIEAAGAALDSTGIGAVVGIPLGIAGAILGAFGLKDLFEHHHEAPAPKPPTISFQAGVN